MPHRSLARVVALLALVAAAAAVVLVIASSDAVTSGGAGAKTKTTTAAKPSSSEATAPGTTTAPVKRIPAVYVVKHGDILSTIAERTGVSVARILELNPDIDPQALGTGQRIKLRP